MLTTTFRRACLVIITALVFGCTAQQHEKISSRNFEQTAIQLAMTIEQQAEMCWQKEPNFFKNGISVKSHRAVQGTFVVTASNWVAGSGVQPAFLVIEIAETNPDASHISISGIRNPEYESYVSDIERWVQGDSGCE